MPAPSQRGRIWCHAYMPVYSSSYITNHTYSQNSHTCILTYAYQCSFGLIALSVLSVLFASCEYHDLLCTIYGLLCNCWNKQLYMHDTRSLLFVKGLARQTYHLSMHAPYQGLIRGGGVYFFPSVDMSNCTSFTTTSVCD